MGCLPTELLFALGAIGRPVEPGLHLFVVRIGPLRRLLPDVVPGLPAAVLLSPEVAPPGGDLSVEVPRLEVTVGEALAEVDVGARLVVRKPGLEGAGDE